MTRKLTFTFADFAPVMTTEKGAREILENIRSIYVPTHRFESVRLEDFKHVDQRFYATTRAVLEQEGFVFFEDAEDVTLASAKGNIFKRVPIRCMVSKDGTIMSGIYHPRLSSLWLRALLFVLRKRIGRIIDFETEFSDGSFVCTTNALSAGALESPPLIDAQYHPVKTPWATLLSAHRERVTRHQNAHSLSIVRIRSIAELRASQNRMNALKAAHRGDLKGITREELEKLSPNKALAHEVHREIQRLNREPAQ